MEKEDFSKKVQVKKGLLFCFGRLLKGKERTIISQKNKGQRESPKRKYLRREKGKRRREFRRKKGRK